MLVCLRERERKRERERERDRETERPRGIEAERQRERERDGKGSICPNFFFSKDDDLIAGMTCVHLGASQKGSPLGGRDTAASKHRQTLQRQTPQRKGVKGEPQVPHPRLHIPGLGPDHPS